LAAATSSRMLVDMKAMIFAAGIGSRLKTLTHDTPKCLMQAGGKTLLEHVIRKLIACGVGEFVINTHHLAHKVEEHLKEHNNFGTTIHLSYEPTLLDTGGGLMKVRDYFRGEDAFVVHNSDIYCTTDLRVLINSHIRNKSVATLAVMQRESRRGLFFDSTMLLQGWSEEGLAAPVDAQLFAFSGMSVCSCEIFNFMDTSRSVFSIIEPFLSAARATGRVRGQCIDTTSWIDIGTPEALHALQQRLGETRHT
jgi:MurNAc alpha-1-phosphate uridylyltransferase